MAAIARECQETKSPIYLTNNGSASLPSDSLFARDDYDLDLLRSFPELGKKYDPYTIPCCLRSIAGCWIASNMGSTAASMTAAAASSCLRSSTSAAIHKLPNRDAIGAEPRYRAVLERANTQRGSWRCVGGLAGVDANHESQGVICSMSLMSLLIRFRVFLSWDCHHT